MALLLPCAVPAEERVVHARGDHYYPPFEYLDEQGNPTGFNVELFRAVADVMGLEIRIELGPWGEIRKELEEGRIDLITGMFYSQARDKLVDFSTPHSIVSHTIFIRKGSPIKTQDDIYGREILVQKGDIVHDYLLENEVTDNMIPVTDQREALLILNKGYHDAAFLSKLQGLYFRTQLNLKNITTIEESLIPRRYCFAVKEGDQELAALLNEGLNILKLNGTYEEIHNRWFGVLERRSALQEVQRVLVIGAAAAVILIALLLVWSWSLRISVQRKTRHLAREIEQRKEMESILTQNRAELQTSLAEKNVLLGEVHHRVKNNLQIISSLLELQRGAPGEERTDAVLLTSQSRIRSMALIHEQLYSSERYGAVNLQQYVDELLPTLFHAYRSEGSRIKISKEVEPVEIDIDRAVPLGLIISEILTNSLKYAFPGNRSGEISVILRRTEKGKLEIILADDGIGWRTEEKQGKTLGLYLIQTLVNQLDGELYRESSTGTRYEIILPLSKT